MRHIKTLRIRKDPKDLNSPHLKIGIYQDVDAKFYARTQHPIFKSSPSIFLPGGPDDAEEQATTLLELTKDVLSEAKPRVVSPAEIANAARLRQFAEAARNMSTELLEPESWLLKKPEENAPEPAWLRDLFKEPAANAPKLLE
jgi:hypothetical protein